MPTQNSPRLSSVEENESFNNKQEFPSTTRSHFIPGLQAKNNYDPASKLCIPLYNVKKLHGGRIKPFFADGSQERLSNLDEVHKVVHSGNSTVRVDAEELNDQSINLDS